MARMETCSLPLITLFLFSAEGDETRKYSQGKTKCSPVSNNTSSVLDFLCKIRSVGRGSFIKYNDSNHHLSLNFVNVYLHSQHQLQYFFPLNLMLHKKFLPAIFP